jgi:single-strand DNA-binding protein
MEYINKVEIRGVIGSIRTQEFDNGEGNAVSKVAHISVVTNFVYKGHNGNPVIETVWHSVEIWNRKGSMDIDSLQKGQTVHIIGRIRSRRYTPEDGEPRDIVEIVATKCTVEDSQESLSPAQQI